VRLAEWREACSSETTVVSRIIACCLAILILAPFTAPFSTCDFAMLFGDAPSPPGPMSAPASTTALAGDANIASVPALLRTGRVRLLEVPRGLTSVAECFSATATRARTSALQGRTHDGAVLAAILRV
jgi:hypothetical protein